MDITEKLNYPNESSKEKKKLVTNLFAEIKAFEAKPKLWQKQLHQNVFNHFPCLESELVDGESDNGVKYAGEIVKLQREFNHRFQDFRSLENNIKIFSMLFNIDVESVPIDVQMEFIELQNDLDLKAKFLSKTIREFYEECLPRSRYPKISKRAQKLICLFGSTYL